MTDFHAAALAGGSAAPVGTSDFILLPAVEVTLTNAELFDGSTQITDAKIAQGKTLTVKPATGYDGVVDVTAGSSVVTGADVTSFDGSKDIALAGAYTVKYSDDITCATVANGGLVVAGKTIAVTIKDSAGAAADTAVFHKAGTNDWALDAAKETASSITVSKALNLVVGTKVTTDANTDVKFYNSKTGNKDTVVAKSAGAIAYVVKGTIIQGEATSTVTVKEDGVNIDASKITSGTNGTSPVVQFEVGTKAITLVGT